jgi:hypothetical protein
MIKKNKKRQLGKKGLRRCFVCKKILKLSFDNFYHSSSRGKMGFNGRCKKCDMLRNGYKNHPYRLIIEKLINRKLNKNEAIHHINGNEKDNREENLYLLTCSKHTNYENNLKTTYLKWIRAEYN